MSGKESNPLVIGGKNREQTRWPVKTHLIDTETQKTVCGLFVGRDWEFVPASILDWTSMLRGSLTRADVFMVFGHQTCRTCGFQYVIGTPWQKHPEWYDESFYATTVGPNLHGGNATEDDYRKEHRLALGLWEVQP